MIVMMIISVKFKIDGKAYYFQNEFEDIVKDDYVLVETEKGIQLGKVYEINIDKDNIKINNELKKVVKKATKKDYDLYLKNLSEAATILVETRKKIEKDEIPMRLIDAMYTFDKKQLIFNFVADERVDFRDLVKYLAAKYKTHIELHQIGVRDKAKEIGGLGQCGRILCCKKFKNSMDGISINMAKNQNISLNPSKINGCCGRLLCCLSYEDEAYSELREKLPKINEIINVDGKKCKVIKVDLLKKQVTVNFDDEEKVVDYNDK